MKVITVWFFHEEGRLEAGHADAARAWAHAHSLPIGSHARAAAFHLFNVAERWIRPEFERLAVAKWERRAGRTGVCVVEHHELPPGTAPTDFRA